MPPAAAEGGGEWTTWLVLGGRGAGKTRTGAEWVRGTALGLPPHADRPVGRIALVGETAADVRDVMIEGVSGLLAVHPRWERPQWQPSRRRLEWRNGAVAQAFSAEDPEALRGPQFGAAWADELCKWRLARETWDMLQFGLRFGMRPRQVVTTTPRPIPLLRALMADPRTAVTRAATRANALNLAPSFLDAVVGRYAGTRLGRQELDGEIVEERADALWTRAALEAARVAQAPPLARLVVAVDPPASSGRRADACGLVVAGIDRERVVYVLEDATLERARPAEWAAKAAALFHRHAADALVVEVNQGGEMATAVLRETDPAVPVTTVRATRGKFLRAEPVAALYEQGRVRHVGAFPALEDEMADFGPGGLSSGRSPDRLDALVWAVTALALQSAAEPRVRGL
ncbi:terminase family protein [Chelatococcus sp. SYSU_G07232]|uniref:Terminase family protein n=1 Tax=Chelatococcus albus TaxID=3047466 RepID=A0ABT7AJ65_9HYPH|nr:terminase family protein [Chelatococcus sp. SYSU_G07232]MDJ1159037.1 terminase family protein [Chelatococcus sp. SYSU_G07232]